MKNDLFVDYDGLSAGVDAVVKFDDHWLPVTCFVFLELETPSVAFFRPINAYLISCLYQSNIFPTLVTEELRLENSIIK